MKKILYLFVVIIAYSCSTSNDDNGNSNTTVVPLPPTGLTGNVASTTQINLSWTDNSTNETGFKIERRTGSANYAVVGTVNQDVLTFSDSGLTPSTTYTYRVYAYNAVGNSLTYSNEITLNTMNNIVFGPNVIDVDANTYMSVSICSQIVTMTNLNVSKYNDGTPIPQVTDPTQWANLTTGAWCYYNNDPANGALYGKLYNWYAVAGIYDAASLANPTLRKKLAPTGWFIPSDDEFTQFTDCLGGSTIAGGKMKATGTIETNSGLWQSPNIAASNESGFTGIPSGYRNNDATFGGIGTYAMWWSSSMSESSSSNPTHAWFRSLYYGYSDVYRSNWSRNFGFSIRCFKN